MEIGNVIEIAYTPFIAHTFGGIQDGVYVVVIADTFG